MLSVMSVRIKQESSQINPAPSLGPNLKRLWRPTITVPYCKLTILSRDLITDAQTSPQDFHWRNESMSELGIFCDYPRIGVEKASWARGTLNLNVVNGNGC